MSWNRSQAAAISMAAPLPDREAGVRGAGGPSEAMSLPMGRIDPVDWAAIVVLQALYREDLFRYIARRVPRREQARKITVEVFAAAAEGLPQFRGQCSPYRWLLAIARRQIGEARRGRRRTVGSRITRG